MRFVQEFCLRVKNVMKSINVYMLDNIIRNLLSIIIYNGKV